MALSANSYFCQISESPFLNRFQVMIVVYCTSWQHENARDEHDGFLFGSQCRVFLIFVCSYYVVFCFKKFNKIKQTPQTLICGKPGLEKIETIADGWKQSLGLVIRKRLHVSVALGIQNIGISFRKWRSQDKVCSEGGRGVTWKKLRVEPSS